MDSYDLEIIQGSSFSLNITLKDEDQLPINLSGYNVSGYLKYKYSDSTKLADLNAQKLVPYASGGINLSISSTGTSSLPITIGVYDVEIFHTGSGITTKVLNGRSYIYPEVTF